MVKSCVETELGIVGEKNVGEERNVGEEENVEEERKAEIGNFEMEILDITQNIENDYLRSFEVPLSLSCFNP
jgi:hypothetical protein